MLEDGVADLVWQTPRRAEVGSWDLGHLDPDAADLEGRAAERGGDVEHLAIALAGHGSGLGDATALGLDLDVDVDGGAGGRIGDVLGRGPDGGPAGGLLEGDEGGSEAAAAEEELPRRDQVRLDREGPAQGVALALETEELLGIHVPRLPAPQGISRS